MLLFGAWALDAGLNSGSVGRNVTVAGFDVGGLDEDDLQGRLAEIAAAYADTEVVVRTGDGDITTTAGVVGLELDTEATAAAAMEVGKGNVVTRPFRWAAGLLGERSAPVVVRLGEGDPAELAEVINGGAPSPTEPTLVVAEGEVVVDPGEPVEIYDLDDLRTEAVAAASGDGPIVVEAGVLSLDPEMTDAEAQVFADQFNAETEAGIDIVVDGQRRRFEPDDIRGWMSFATTDNGFDYVLDQVRVKVSLAGTFARPDQDPADLEVVVVNGQPSLDGFIATRCCADSSDERILQSLRAGRSEAVMDLEEGPTSETDLLEEYGIIELIGEATTPHNCCQSRVTNIQLFADLMTGVIIQPGETLSLNEFVGPRTREKGFVESGVIYAGRLQTDVGGGISQFATTIFQAMFYAGIDIDEYQAHTLWFSRYEDHEGRRGIESTISFPQPDVAFTNNTPYPVLIWPTYTDTSLTVSLYSTKWVVADVAEQAIYGSGQCTVIDTDRIRTYPDGTEAIDTFQALYQPRDGIGCDGRPTDPTVPTPTPTPDPDAENEDDGGDGGNNGDGGNDGDGGNSDDGSADGGDGSADGGDGSADGGDGSADGGDGSADGGDGSADGGDGSADGGDGSADGGDGSADGGDGSADGGGDGSADGGGDDSSADDGGGGGDDGSDL